MEQVRTADTITGSSLVMPDFTPTEQEALNGEIIGYVPDTPATVYSLQTVPYPERLKTAATLQTNDTGLGQRIALHFKERMAFVVDDLSGGRAWHIYNDQNGVWERDISGGLARELAIRVTNSLNDELSYISSSDAEEGKIARGKLERAKNLPDGEIREKAIKAAESAIARIEGASLSDHLKFIKASNSGAGHWTAALQVAEGLLKRRAEDFDADPACINTPQGLLNLRTLELMPPSPANLVTMITHADYVPGAKHPDVDRVIARLDEGGHPGLARFTQRYLGSGLTSLPAAKTVFYQNGVPDSGKSTVILSAVEALGMSSSTGYATTADPKIFCRSNADANGADTKLHNYRGKRMLFADEADKAGLLGEVFKKWASGEPLTTRAQHEMAFQWYPVGTLVMAGNGVIGLPTDDDGVTRRFISCGIPTPVKDLDVDLRNRMKTREAYAAMFAWLVEGAHSWLAEGASREAFCITEQMEKETQGYVGDADPFADFIEECVETAPGPDYLPIKFAAWKEIYNQWCSVTRSESKPDRVLKNYLGRFAVESTPTMAQHDGWKLSSKTRVLKGIAMKKPDYGYLEHRGYIAKVDQTPVLHAIKLAA